MNLPLLLERDLVEDMDFIISRMALVAAAAWRKVVGPASDEPWCVASKPLWALLRDADAGVATEDGFRATCSVVRARAAPAVACISGLGG